MEVKKEMNIQTPFVSQLGDDMKCWW